MNQQDYIELNTNNNREVAYMLNNNSLAVKDAGETFLPFYIHREKNVESVRSWLTEEKQAEFEALTGTTTPTVAELKELQDGKSLDKDGSKEVTPNNADATTTATKGKTKKP